MTMTVRGTTSMAVRLDLRAVLLILALPLLAAGPVLAQAPPEPGLLFHLSGDRGITADYSAGGTPEPNFASGVRVVPGGAKGAAIECDHMQLYSFWAPGNIYAQRGTLAFFWRAREAVGPTEFPVFRVGYADHSSWDMVWLRIDYNGKPGFDAFVTDASLARTRVSYALPGDLAPDRWVHLALSWDETRGIRFYVDGQLAGTVEGAARFDAALDQFGPHSRIISPYQVQSAYNFVRGGDIDELRIYDRMLADDRVAALARGEAPEGAPVLTRDMATPAWRDAWWYRYGWNRPGDAPPPLEAREVAIRKVEIHDVYDVKRWWWKGTDGIRETTWPGVYNRSRLPGRTDYFVLPDWDCYSTSGQAVTFTMPHEPWNQIEVSGAAFGAFSLLDGNVPETTAGAASGGHGGPAPAPGRELFARPRGQERTTHRLGAAALGGRVHFVNVEQETPIGELSAYHVAPGRAPSGVGSLRYRLSSARVDVPGTEPILRHIHGRHPVDERATMLALPPGLPAMAAAPQGMASAAATLPLVHVVVPAEFREVGAGVRRSLFTYSWANMSAGLDGIVLELPALNVKPTHGEHFPLNIQVKDPLWPLRTMLDVNISVKPGEPHTLWLDTRDRLLPPGKSLYLTIAGAGGDFGPAALEGAELRLVFKPRKDALGEHVLDRFTQVRDNYAHLVEENPRTRRLNTFTRFEADVTDLLRADPDHVQGQRYWYDHNREQPRPSVTLGTPPPGVPEWAFRQTELLGYVKRFVNWYIDHRQIENGEFGGGLSDDGDLTNWWPGTALMGATPDKILASLRRHMEAFYEQGLFTDGLSTIQTDELHSYEEGIQVLGQSMLLDFGNPRHLERAMDTAAALERITGVNAAGHRHFRSTYFSGTKIAEEGVWGWQKPQSFLVLHPAIALVEYNGAPRVRKLLLELADGLLAHLGTDASGAPVLRPAVEFASDRAIDYGSDRPAWPLLWAAYRWTGDRKYVEPLLAAGTGALSALTANALDLLRLRDQWGPRLLAEEEQRRDTNPWRHLAWQLTGDTGWLTRMYADQSAAAALREYINTEGSLWIDRVSVEHGEIQRARLGGVALVRNGIVPGHVVSWQFAGPSDDERVAILVPDATTRRVRIQAYNLSSAPIAARMSAWDIEPGRWRVTEGTAADTSTPAARGNVRTTSLERGSEMDVTFAPGVVTVIELEHVSGGTPYWQRPDLALDPGGVRREGDRLHVTVHSVGAVDAPASRIVVLDRDGRTVATASVPALRAPVNLVPQRAQVTLALPQGIDLTGAHVAVEMSGRTPEITRRNNQLPIEN
jgi:hypothetical protein